jgi:hypothetical protein
MRRLIPVLVAAAALALPAAAGATVKGMHQCLTTAPGFVYSLWASPAVGCGTARTVERYAIRHEILTRTVTIAGVRWAYNRAGSTEESLVGPHWRTVTIFHRPSG